MDKMFGVNQESIESILPVSPLQCTLLTCDCEQSAITAPPHHHITMGPWAYLHVVEKSLSYFIHSAFITLSVVTCAAAMLLLTYNYAMLKANRNTYITASPKVLKIFSHPQTRD